LKHDIAKFRFFIERYLYFFTIPMLEKEEDFDLNYSLATANFATMGDMFGEVTTPSVRKKLEELWSFFSKAEGFFWKLKGDGIPYDIAKKKVEKDWLIINQLAKEVQRTSVYG
jgi:hypothetical protein